RPASRSSALALRDALPILVEGHGPRAVDPQSDVEVGGLRQAADERGERLLGRGDPQAAVGQLVEHRARGVEDEDDVRRPRDGRLDRKSTRLNSSHAKSSYA